ncbi:N-acyl homoserine lactonase family protein [Paraburkholderia sp.]|uniref:N-acyl homoserine lactonase family protein n=1 Tax=Paraburkholderia sp. TaxID=1926495 RepID=UPI0039E5BFF5
MKQSIARILSLCAMTVLTGVTQNTFAAELVKVGAGSDADLKLYVIDCGVLLYNNPNKFGYKKEDLKETNLSNGCYLIVDPGKGTLLWDTGVIPDNLWKGDGISPKKFYAEGTRPLKEQLAEIGYQPDDIKYVAVANQYWDHISNLYQFANDTWLTSKITRDKLLSSNAPEHTDPALFSSLKDTKTITIPDDKNYDVFGDGSIIIIPTPGHTPDHHSLLVNLKRTGPIIISGDLWHYTKDFETNFTQNNDDRPTTLLSRARILQLAKKINANIWIPHDYIQFSQLKKSPEYYN